MMILMYGKLFASLYEGTMRGRAHEILVFTNMLAFASKDGTVDRHPRTMADETGLTVDEVWAAIANLEAPDIESRSQEMGGRRIVRLDEHRNWGWQIVNHGKYRRIKNEEDRREQNRVAQRNYKERRRAAASSSAADSAESAESKQNKPMQYVSVSASDSEPLVSGSLCDASAKSVTRARDITQAEAEAEAEGTTGKYKPPTPLRAEQLPTRAADVTASDQFAMRSTVFPIFQSLPAAQQRNRMDFLSECIAAMGRGASQQGLVEAFRAYFASPEGSGAYFRAPTTLLANDFWTEPREAWGGRKQAAEEPQVNVSEILSKARGA